MATDAFDLSQKAEKEFLITWCKKKKKKLGVGKIELGRWTVCAEHFHYLLMKTSRSTLRELGRRMAVISGNVENIENAGVIICIVCHVKYIQKLPGKKKYQKI